MTARCPGSEFSDRAVYLGDGVWWQLTNAQKAASLARGLPEMIRPAPRRVGIGVHGRELIR